MITVAGMLLYSIGVVSSFIFTKLYSSSFRKLMASVSFPLSPSFMSLPSGDSKNMTTPVCHVPPILFVKRNPSGVPVMSMPLDLSH